MARLVRDHLCTQTMSRGKKGEQSEPTRGLAEIIVTIRALWIAVICGRIPIATEIE